MLKIKTVLFELDVFSVIKLIFYQRFFANYNYHWLKNYNFTLSKPKEIRRHS